MSWHTLVGATTNGKGNIFSSIWCATISQQFWPTPNRISTKIILPESSRPKIILSDILLVGEYFNR